MPKYTSNEAFLKVSQKYQTLGGSKKEKTKEVQKTYANLKPKYIKRMINFIDPKSAYGKM